MTLSNAAYSWHRASLHTAPKAAKAFNLRGKPFQQLLAQAGLGSAPLIGHGRHAVVFDMGDGTVAKLTADALWLDYVIAGQGRFAHVPQLLTPPCAMAYADGAVTLLRLPCYRAVKGKSTANEQMRYLRKACRQERLQLQARLTEQWPALSRQDACPNLLPALLDALALRCRRALPPELCDTLRWLGGFVASHPQARNIRLEMVDACFLTHEGHLLLYDPLLLAAP